MQEDFRLIVDLVIVLAAAAGGGLLAALLKQPVLLGYLVGGAIVGPAGLGLVKELIQVETLAQFGAAFLLFALGVEFSFSELKKVQGISLGGGGLQICLTVLVTALVSTGVGWVSSPTQGVFLGAILSLSSTAVVLKCLMEKNETETAHGRVMLGILVVQDLALGVMLAVLPALNQPSEEIGVAIAIASTKDSAVGRRGDRGRNLGDSAAAAVPGSYRKQRIVPLGRGCPLFRHCAADGIHGAFD